jgi:transposase InsO family protein
MAFAQRRPASGAIFHSDRSCQYTSKDYAAEYELTHRNAARQAA